MKFLSEWHVYAFTSNRSATTCNITIEEFVSYTQLPLLFNKIDRVALVYCTVKSLSFSFVLIESIFFFFVGLDSVKEKEREENMYM
jgi:hypothetical protein